MDFIAKPLGSFLYFIYNNLAFQNYGLAIIIFTVIVRLFMLPLTIKQYHSMAKMQEAQPLLQELQRKYKNDKEKLQIETMKFYQENKINPAGSCLPLLVQMPILFALFYAITRPLTYMLGWPAQKIADTLKVLKATKGFELISGYDELSIVIHEKLLNLNFLGLNLGMKPTLDFSRIFSSWQYFGLILIPLLAAATTYISSKLSMANSAQNNTNAQVAQTNKTMLYFTPLMSLYFSFIVPASLGVYWTTGYVIQIFQQLFINKFILKKKKEVATK